MNRSLKHYLIAIIVALAGLLTLSGQFFAKLHTNVYTILPLGDYRFSRLTTVALGLVLLYTSLQLIKRKQLAFVLTTASMTILLAFEVLRPHGLGRPIIYALTLGLLLLNRKEYVVKNDNLSLRRGLGAAMAILVFALLYGALGFYVLHRREFGYDFDLLPSLKYSFLQLFTIQDAGLVPHSRYAKLFLDSLNVMSATALALAFSSLFKPLRFALGANKHDRKLAEQILQKYSTSVEDFFKVWPEDKHYFFSDAGDAFLAYKVSGGNALVLDGPSGNSKQFSGMLANFTSFATANGWTPVIIHGDQPLETVVTPLQYKQLFIGNEALVDVEMFAATTYRSKHFRYIQNKSRRENLSFELWPAPLTSAQLGQLATISKQWLQQGGRREYTFLMGYFEPAYLEKCSVAVLIQSGQPIAYTNLIPTFIDSARSIDHMRYVPEIPSTGMHYLLMQLILHLHAEGIRTFNLGLSPLSGIEKLPDASLAERFLRSVKTIGRTYYSFDGLEQFKNKFEPEWQPRYIYHQGFAANLVTIAQNLNRATTVHSVKARRKFAIITASIIAGLTYVSFPLGYLLNPRSHGLVSDLGGMGQPYAWVFNGLDIISGASMMILGFLLWTIPERTHRRAIRTCIGLLVLSGASNAIAAVTPLAGAQGINVQVILHDFLSAINFLATIAAASVFMVRVVLPETRSRITIKNIFLWAGFVLLVVASIVSVIFQAYGSGLVQRIFICLAGLWVAILGISISRPRS
jgi:phosphatidylglycerol lysyltransferase